MIFPLASVSRPALGPTQTPVQWVPAVLSPGLKRGRAVTLTTHPCLVPRSRMSSSYTSCPPGSIVACSGTALAFGSKIYDVIMIHILVYLTKYKIRFENKISILIKFQLSTDLFPKRFLPTYNFVMLSKCVLVCSNVSEEHTASIFRAEDQH
jgi:hypothetical protein